LADVAPYTISRPQVVGWRSFPCLQASVRVVDADHARRFKELGATDTSHAPGMELLRLPGDDSRRHRSRNAAASA
jgi:hypothetical protein